jgi:hypothetical protein
MTLKTRNAIGTGSTSGIGLAIARALAKEGVNRLVDSGKLSRDDYMRPFVHRIDGGRHLEFFPASSKLDASWTVTVMKSCASALRSSRLRAVTSPVRHSSGRPWHWATLNTVYSLRNGIWRTSSVSVVFATLETKYTLTPCSPLRTTPPTSRSGSRTASPPSRPLRTVHASFPAHGSSKPLTIPVALFLREDLKVTKKMHQPLIVEGLKGGAHAGPRGIIFTADTPCSLAKRQRWNPPAGG